MLQKINTNSKLSLKMTCLACSKGDLEQAQKLYDYFSAGMDLPDTDPVSPGTFQQVKETAGSIFGWVKENKDDLAQAFNFIQTLRGKAGPAIQQAASEIPPLPAE